MRVCQALNKFQFHLKTLTRPFWIYKQRFQNIEINMPYVLPHIKQDHDWVVLIFLYNYYPGLCLNYQKKLELNTFNTSNDSSKNFTLTSWIVNNLHFCQHVNGPHTKCQSVFNFSCSANRNHCTLKPINLHCILKHPTLLLMILLTGWEHALNGLK
jgi:hypothetical protein